MPPLPTFGPKLPLGLLPCQWVSECRKWAILTDVRSLKWVTSVRTPHWPSRNLLKTTLQSKTLLIHYFLSSFPRALYWKEVSPWQLMVLYFLFCQKMTYTKPLSYHEYNIHWYKYGRHSLYIALISSHFGPDWQKPLHAPAATTGRWSRDLCCRDYTAGHRHAEGEVYEQMRWSLRLAAAAKPWTWFQFWGFLLQRVHAAFTILDLPLCFGDYILLRFTPQDLHSAAQHNMLHLWRMK